MTDGGWFGCPACHARYGWLAAQAGRRVRCRCGTVIRIPMQPGEEASVIEASAAPAKPRAPHVPDTSSASPFELELSVPAPSKAAAPASPPTPASSRQVLFCRHCGQAMRAFAVLCTNCGTPAEGWKPEPTGAIPLESGVELEAGEPVEAQTAARTASTTGLVEAMQRRSELVEADAAYASRHAWFMDIILPGGLIAAGIVMIFIYAWGYGNPNIELPLWGDLLLVLMDVLVNFVCLFAGLIIVSKLFGEAVGTLLVTTWKLAAMAIFLVAADSMFYWGLDVITEGFASLGGYIRIAFKILVFWPLCAMLLDLEVLETVILFIISRMLPVVVMMFAATMIYAMFG